MKRSVAKDGTPFYTVTVDGTPITAFEQHVWHEDSVRSVSAGRLTAMVGFTGLTITDPQSLLVATFETHGLPSYGLDEDGHPTMQTAFPIAPTFPVDLARRQLMVCMGTLAEEANELRTIREKKRAQAKQEEKPAQAKQSGNWDLAKNVATVAGTFLKAFAGL